MPPSLARASRQTKARCPTPAGGRRRTLTEGTRSEHPVMWPHGLRSTRRFTEPLSIFLCKTSISRASATARLQSCTTKTAVVDKPAGGRTSLTGRMHFRGSAFSEPPPARRLAACGRNGLPVTMRPRSALARLPAEVAQRHRRPCHDESRPALTISSEVYGDRVTRADVGSGCCATRPPPRSRRSRRSPAS